MLVCCTVPWQNNNLDILFFIMQHKFILGIVIPVKIVTASKQQTSKLEMNQILDQLKN